MITISIDKYIKYIPVVIDDTKYQVRRIGAGEQLDISQILSEMQKLRADVLNSKENTEKASKAVEKFGKLSEKLEKVFCNLFKDENGGKDVENLVHKLGIENISKLITDIFSESDNE